MEADVAAGILLPRLMYVDKEQNLAYFSTNPEVIGDDWEDAPWEHNSGRPYTYDARVVWVGWEWERPGQWEYNSTVSVDDINNGAAPWLSNKEKQVYIHAGDSVSEFSEKIRSVGDIPMPVFESQPIPGSAPTEPDAPRLSPHTAAVLDIYGVPNGADAHDSMYWSTQEGEIRLYANCSDTFAWATADAEEILPADVPLLRECLRDLRAIESEWLLSELFAARKRGIRPMALWMEREEPRVQALFPEQQ